MAIAGGVAWHHDSAQNHLLPKIEAVRQPKSKKLHSVAVPQMMSGVIEGFYGPRWSVSATDHVLKFMAGQDMNTFVYAPKNVPYLRAKWNIPYPPAHLKKLQNLVDTARDEHIAFVCSISPGLSIEYSSSQDRTELLGKINELWGIGIHAFMLSFDDIPSTLEGQDALVYHGNLALAQCSLVNAIIAKENSEGHHATWLFTPTSYSGVADNSYWATLKAHLMAGVPVIWTGPYVLSSTISTQNADAVQTDIGHPLVLWDNYPVNDYTYVIDHHPQLFLGPVLGRSSSLPAHLRGYLFNPMLQPYASEIALFTGASYLRSPAHYDPSQAWQKALLDQSGPSGLAAFKSFAGANSVSFLDTHPRDGLDINTVAFWNTVNQGGDVTRTALYREFSRWPLDAKKMEETLPAPLYREMAPWIAIYSREGQLGVEVIDQLKSKTSATSSAADKYLQQQSAINTAADQLGVHTILAAWFAKAFSLPPFTDH